MPKGAAAAQVRAALAAGVCRREAGERALGGGALVLPGGCQALDQPRTAPDKPRPGGTEPTG